MTEDLSRRSFLVGAGQAVGAACLVPVLSFAPEAIAKIKVPVAEKVFHENIWYRTSMISVGQPEMRMGYWPDSFTPYNYEISFEQTIADVLDLDQRMLRRIQSMRELRVDLSLDYIDKNKEIFEAMEESMFNNEPYKLALNLAGTRKQLIGDFIVTELDISNMRPM